MHEICGRANKTWPIILDASNRFKGHAIYMAEKIEKEELPSSPDTPIKVE